MSLVPGSRLGPYEIVSPIGEGGMGEVYKARDTRLDRTVAIKVLPTRLSGDADLRQRFQREARAVSSLNHPHICTLHDVGHQDGVDYLVMEFIEGETLADRLKKGALPLELALRHAIEIGDALDKAHQHGVVHRDLKPGNVMLAKEGTKLLDFGLAKFREDVSAETSAMLSALPTEEKPLTREGSILGTFQYMAPEQLEGKEADTRTDIFSFGTVLYEMLTGRKAFEAESRASLIAAIMEHDPAPIADYQQATHPGLERAIKKCLAKDPGDRWQSAHDLVDELRWVRDAGGREDVPLARGRSRERFVWTSLVALLVAALATVWMLLGRDRAPPSEEAVRFNVTAPEGTNLSMRQITNVPAISPDGRHLAFAATDATGQSLIWVRSLDTLDAHPLPGTEGTITFFWSPNSQSIGFTTVHGLMKVDRSGTVVQSLCSLTFEFGRGTWNRDGVILFAAEEDGPIYRISSAGGTPEPVTKLDPLRGEIRHVQPQFLPDGRHFLYYSSSRHPELSGMYAGSLDSPVAKRLLPEDSRALYAAPGYLLFVRDGNLLAQPFDPGRLQVLGERIAVAGPVDTYHVYGTFSVSENGVLAYRPPIRQDSRLTWFDREGNELGTVLAPETCQNLELSPDGRQLAVECFDPETSFRDIWIVGLERGTASRLTHHASDDSDPLWSPDGSDIVFASNRDGAAQILRVPAGGGSEEVIHQSDYPRKYTSSWSPDGRNILLLSSTQLLLLPLSEVHKPKPLFDSGFFEIEGQFSPGGGWVSYSSNETGRSEVYLQRFPPTGEKWRISTDGGTDARWRSDGKELYYLAPDRTLMAVEIHEKGDTLEASMPKALFETRISGTLGVGLRFNYVVGTGGERFLINTLEEGGASPPIVVILNWTAELGR